MKRYLVYSLYATVALGAVAATKTDLGSRARLRSKKAPIEMVKTPKGEAKIMKQVRTRSAEDETIRAFITVKEGTKAADLEAAGVNVQSLRGTIALGEFSLSNLENVEALDCVVSIRTESPVSQKMDRTRQAIGVDKIHAGEGLPRAFSGKGVIAGVVDGGFDPSHVNFLDENGVTRFKQLNIYRYGQSANGAQTVEVANITGDKFERLDTDDDQSYHATHTTGIMAGNYRGKVKAGEAVDFRTGKVVEVDNPYYGIAYDADIVAAAADGGNLTDYFVSLGCESILDYAWEVNQPAVINLSLGSNIGAHDGSSPLCQYIDAIVADDQVNCIVCMSAGNEGDQPIAINKTLTADDNQVGSFLTSMMPQLSDGYTTYLNPRSGQVYIYSDTDEPFEIQAQVFNKQRGTVATRFPLSPSATGEGVSQYWVSSSDWQGDTADKVDPTFGKYFEGYIGLAGMLDADSGRYYTVIDFTCWDNPSNNANGNYAISFQVTGKDGQRIDIYGDGTWVYFSGNGVNGYTDGGFDGTISDLSCGKNPIVVGAYTTRNYWASLDSGVYGYWDDVIPMNQICPFSSFGKLVDGRELPHITAPGASIISSSNKYYIDLAGMSDADIQARAEANGRNNDFHQSIGTSMSSPVVAGTIAVLLEADPTLKAAEARDIIMRTAVKDESVTNTGNPLQWGAGKLDAYAALKEVLKGVSGVSEIAADGSQRLEVRRNGSIYDILVPGASSVSAKVYNVSGACVLDASANGNEISLDTSALVPGVYVVKVNNGSIKLSIN